MPDKPYQTARLSEIPTLGEDAVEWKPLRHYFGIASFGTNAYIARSAGDEVIATHTEVEHSGTEHEELYYVAAGHATFTVADEELDAPAGTFVYISNPGSVRRAVAREADTTMLAFGGTPGQAFAVSNWEAKHHR